MELLFAYLAVGVATLLVAFGSHCIRMRREPAYVPLFLEQANPARKTLAFYRLISGVVVPALAAIGMILGWPIALLVAIKHHLEERDSDL